MQASPSALLGFRWGNEQRNFVAITVTKCNRISLFSEVNSFPSSPFGKSGSDRLKKAKSIVDQMEHAHLSLRIKRKIKYSIKYMEYIRTGVMKVSYISDHRGRQLVDSEFCVCQKIQME